MKRFILAILFGLSALALPAHAQDPELYRLYLPLVEADMPIACTKPWRLISPEASTNFTLNPSAETTGNFAAAAAGVVARSTTYQHYGLYSYSVTTAANGDGISLTTSALAATAHYVTLRVRGTLPPAWRVGIGAASKAARKIEVIDPDWTLYGVAFSAAESSAAVAVTVTQSGAGAGDFYLDGVQVEALGHPTSYIDGTREGCTWLGTAHASASERSAQSLAGGELLDLWDEFNFFTEEMIGVGASPLSLDVRSYAILPGGELAGRKVEPRQFTLIGRFIGHSEAELHDKRQALIQALSADSYAGQQPVRLRFAGARVQKEIDAYYEGGLEAELPVTYGTLQTDGDEWRYMRYWTERVSIQFLAPDPMWYEVGESASELAGDDKLYMRRVLARRRSSGQWDDMNNTVDPTTASEIDTIVIGPDGLVYIGGTFTGWGGVAGRDYIAVYDPVADTWANVGGASDFNAIVAKLIFGPDGTLYAGGSFTNVAADANADYIAQWDGANWSAVGQPVQGAAAITVVNDMAFDSAGNLVIVGDFTNWANIAAADYIVQWDGASYSAIGSGGTGVVQAVALDQSDNIYIGGDFNNWAADANADKLAWWNGTAWAAVQDTALNGIVYDLIFTEDGILYIAGGFTDAAGISNADYIVAYNGTAFAALGSGANGDVIGFSIINNTLYAVGAFTTMGGITLTNKAARWNGASWAHLDVDWPSTANPVLGLATGNQDTVVGANFDMYIGANVSGVATSAGLTSITNEGTRPAFPELVFQRTDGRPAAEGVLSTVRNETTGKELLFNYGLVPGEKLTIDLEPTAKSITSAFWGPRMTAILANSDFGLWSLLPGSNDVTVFVNVDPDEQNDNNNLLNTTRWDGVTGIDEDNTDDGRLYVSVIDDGGGFFHVALYKDSARGAPDLVGHTASYNTTGLKAVVADNASGLGGYVTVQNVTVADADIYVDYAIVDAWLLFRATFLSLD